MSASSDFVHLQGGLVVPVGAFNLALYCESIGVKLTARGQTLDVEGPHTPELLADLKRWKPHVLAVLNYTASDAHLFDDTIPRPPVGPILQVSK